MNEVSCRTCGVPKPQTADFFYRDPKNRSGLKSECKVCQRERNQRWFTSLPPDDPRLHRIRNTHARWGRIHRAERRVYEAQWRKDHPEQVAAVQRAWLSKRREERARERVVSAPTIRP